MAVNGCQRLLIIDFDGIVVNDGFVVAPVVDDFDMAVAAALEGVMMLIGLSKVFLLNLSTFLIFFPSFFFFFVRTKIKKQRDGRMWIWG